MAGGKIDILVEPDTRGFESKLKAGLAGPVAAAGKLGAAMGLALGAQQAASKILQVGVDFQSSLNGMAAVTQATAAQMDQVAAKARALGADTELTATSASDAAAAMTELAKGGFSVQQSMDAARGTLQLAAAAQVDAASAATIQAQALQAFQLGAEGAAHVSDILAGAANASSAQMTDVAAALQQAGAVANTFGVSIDDTVTSISMFANAGITGSDAGTMLKTALLALTDQSKPAQAAMEELGLTVYDAQGKFVGLPKLIEDLNRAAATMTEEQYQAATATLFGSDAMRFAGVAASTTREDFETLRDAVTRQGQAAEVAAAQTKGLPGAMERLSNTSEEAALALFEVVKVPLEKTLDGATKALEEFSPKLTEHFAAAVDTISELGTVLAPIGGALYDVASAAASVDSTIVAALGAIYAFNRFDLGSKFGLAAKSVRELSQGMKDFRAYSDQMGHSLTRTEAAMTMLGTSSNKHLAKMGRSYMDTSSKFSAYIDKQKAGIAKLEDAAAKGGIAFDHIGNQAQIFGKKSTIAFATASRGAAAMATSVSRSLGSAALGLMGGPWGAALTALTVTISGVSSAWKAEQEAQKQIAEAASKAQSRYVALTEAIAGTSGALGTEGLAAATEVATGKLTEFMAKGEQMEGWQSWFAPMGDAFKGLDPTENLNKQSELNEISRGYNALKESAQQMGIELEDVAGIVAAGGPQYDALIERLEGSGNSGARAAEELRNVRSEMELEIDAARRVDPELAKAAAATQKLADASASADEKLTALETILQAMGLAPKNATSAMMDAQEAIEGVIQRAEEMNPAAAGMGQALFDAAGNLDITNANSRKLHDELNNLRAGLEKVAVNGGDVNQTFEQSKAALDVLGRQYGLTSEQVEQLTREYGLVPDVISTLVDLEGAPDAVQQIAAVWQAAYDLPAGKTVEISAPSDEAMEALEVLGVKLDKTPDGKNVRVTAETAEAAGRLQEAISLASNLGEQEVSVKAAMDLSPLEMSASSAQALLEALNIQEPSPKAQLIIDKLQSNQQISMGELAVLASQSPTPIADLDKKLFDAGATDVANSVKKINESKATATIDADTSGFMSKVQSAWNWAQRLFSASTAIGQGVVGAGRRLVGFASGGVVAAYASGGRHGGYRLPTTGPGTGVTDGFLGVDSAGVPVARLDAGEWIINGESSRRYSAELAAINAGVFPKLPGFALGGVFSASQLLAFAAGELLDGDQAKRSLEGAPYRWAGVDWGDCSGAMSGLANNGLCQILLS